MGDAKVDCRDPEECGNWLVSDSRLSLQAQHPQPSAVDRSPRLNYLRWHTRSPVRGRRRAGIDSATETSKENRPWRWTNQFVESQLSEPDSSVRVGRHSIWHGGSM